MENRQQSFERPPLSVFTKPWPSVAISQLGDTVSEMGFEGVELPARSGFQVEPESIEESLPKAVETLKRSGVSVLSVAGSLDEQTARACVNAGVPILRTMLRIESGKSYIQNIDTFRRKCEKLARILEGSGTTIGLQNHCDQFVTSSVGLLHAIDPLPEEAVSAVLDLGHTGLDGEREEMAIDIVWPRLSMVNLKNAIRYREGTDSYGATVWNRTWVSGKEGYTSWAKVIEELSKRGFRKPICLTAEYKGEAQQLLAGDEVIPYLENDLTFLKQLIEKFYARQSDRM